MVELRLMLMIGGYFLWISASAYGEVVLEYHTPTPDSSPADLAFDALGNLWFTELNANRIGKLDPSKAKSLTSQGITEYELPQPNSKPHFLTIAKNGLIWFTEGANRIGSLDPENGTFKEYDIPSPHSEPHQIIEAPDGSIWFVEFQTNKVGQLDPKNRQDYRVPDRPRQSACPRPGKKQDLVHTGRHVLGQYLLQQIGFIGSPDRRSRRNHHSP